MPSFRGKPGPGAFATYDTETGESNELGPFAKKGPVRKGGDAGTEGEAKVGQEHGKDEAKKD
jgi:hypothetical protein